MPNEETILRRCNNQKVSPQKLIYMKYPKKILNYLIQKVSPSATNRYSSAPLKASNYWGYSYIPFAKMGLILIISISILLGACKMNKTQKGAAIGTASGGAMGAVIGKATGNTGMGAIIGAAVGGAAGAVIGHQMDKQAKEIEQSLPGVKVDRVGEGIVVEFSNNVLFGYDKSFLTDEAKASLTNLVQVLNTYPDTNIEIQGHTDSDGSTAYNQTLSEQRAIAVSNNVISKSIDAKRIIIRGFGENVPKYDNESEAGKAKNRRVEFLITANEKMKQDAKSSSNE